MAKQKIPQATKVESVGEVEVSEIDFELRDEFFGKNWDADDRMYPRMIGNYQYGHPYNIGKMIKILQGLKKKGATHVSMRYHEDHIGYEIEGLKITKAGQVDHLRAVEKEKKLSRLQAQYDLLEKGQKEISQQMLKLQHGEE